MRAAGKEHLERSTLTTFAEFSRGIGSKSTVLEDVDTGNYDMPNPSETLPFRTSNRGGVGFACRILDTLIANVPLPTPTCQTNPNNPSYRVAAPNGQHPFPVACAGFGEAAITSPHISTPPPEASNGGGPRVPSYTNCILFHSVMNVEAWWLQVDAGVVCP
ncbi:hypothetical protein H310_10975 [Aphanomyces invadans]|uniref:Uncharacterized protein n=1 Tax=Aphanomyces invadans TaxID=157072 RepID=A0A024TQ98_9STRA|nr:hypothetical protein H310_10975 [Aphanomyces invadans]ETV95507.1 hypothetical protein H310_10975 [Aphanomyces invadans]|eukprot:XP_008875700.1 hypothetical protein H310_10975 [Aphanomyces invadans]